MAGDDVKFLDRADAGRALALALEHLRGQNLLVCGLPRGGVPVAYEVALALDAPLDVIVVRKLGFPGQPELAMGAVGEGGARFVDDAMVARSGLTLDQLTELEANANAEVERTAAMFRNGLARVARRGRTVVLVDDGLATGSTARAACAVAAQEGAAHIVLAVPVAPVGWMAALDRSADEYVCLHAPTAMVAVGFHYRDFSATSETEVAACLAGIAARAP